MLCICAVCVAYLCMCVRASCTLFAVMFKKISLEVGVFRMLGRSGCTAVLLYSMLVQCAHCWGAKSKSKGKGRGKSKGKGLLIIFGGLP